MTEEDKEAAPLDPPAEDHPLRYGCLLRIRRAVRQPGSPWQAGRRRRIPRTGRRGGGKLRSPQVWGKVCYAVGDAHRQCPDLIFVKPRFEVYRSVSQQIREIFAAHTPMIEPLSLDEAYLDVTENLQGVPLARDVALAIRAKIKAETGLNASTGISYNKFLAKLASDDRKPNGQCDHARDVADVRRGAACRQSAMGSDRSCTKREDLRIKPQYLPNCSRDIQAA